MGIFVNTVYKEQALGGKYSDTVFSIGSLLGAVIVLFCLSGHLSCILFYIRNVPEICRKVGYLIEYDIATIGREVCKDVSSSRKLIVGRN